MQLSQDVGHRRLVFIRFNPDGYTNGVKKIKSCWGFDGKNMCVVKTQTEWLNRLACLKTQIEYWMTHKTDKMIEIVELFYDNE
jgi:hypothetical protein